MTLKEAIWWVMLLAVMVFHFIPKMEAGIQRIEARTMAARP